ncbi:glycosyltransferase family 39 protein [Pseudomonas pharyngis]|uniref:glycosyltransferase family 39 protein n=1 Tax=Pseudomonas pharyngis TaxID=2892333 RepID=UPI001F2F9F0C|nr:glycosyltransferase family 39 protein [Pseudomonas pharyngis]
MKFNKLSSQYLSPMRGIQIISLLTLVYAFYIALHYAGQPLIELFGFRQTQTALTSFWFIQEGYKLAYETPVSGAPWSIPFEFPLYQAIVAFISQLFHSDLGKTGRIVSFAFLVFCLYPANEICKSLKLSRSSFYLFAGLLFSSPVYLFWGRTFMIETMALFFAILAIKFFLDFLNNKGKWAAAGFFASISLAILQKATTGLPVLAILAVVFLFHEINRNKSIVGAISIKNIFWAMTLFALPIVIGYGWTLYTDIIKSKNEFGMSITSQSLSAWNWGTLTQRLSLPLYTDVIWSRIIKGNLSGIFGVAIILGAMLLTKSNKLRLIIAAACALGILPLFIFTNLHLVHTYYQSANVIFLIFALAVAVGESLDGARRTAISVIVFLALVLNNYGAFASDYFLKVREDLNIGNSRDLMVGDALNMNMSRGEAVVVYGNDWSSSIAYYAEHKSFTVPDRFRNLDKVINTPEAYLGGLPLGAIAACPESPVPTVRQLVDWKHNGNPWKAAEVWNCIVAFPDKSIGLDLPKVKTDCQGNLDYVGDTTSKTPGTVQFKGWTTVDGAQNTIPSQVYITLTDATGAVRYYGAVQSYYYGVGDLFKRPDMASAGFGRIIDTSTLSGKYTVGVERVVGQSMQVCQFSKELQVNK